MAAAAVSGTESTLNYNPPPRTYKELTYSEIKNIILQLEADHPDFVEIFTAQEEYGLESPGPCGQDGPCVQVCCY
jgi:hypothetical protein